MSDQDPQPRDLDHKHDSSCVDRDDNVLDDRPFTDPGGSGAGSTVQEGVDQAFLSMVNEWVEGAFPDSGHGIREAARWGFDNGYRRGSAAREAAQSEREARGENR